MTDAPAPRLHVLRAAGVGLVLAERAGVLPELVHLGADLGEDVGDLLRASEAPVPNSGLDARWALSLLPT